MIVSKQTINNSDTKEFKNALDTVKQFSNIDFSNIDVVFTFKIVGRKVLEFYILYTCGGGNELVADITNKTTQKLSDFKWGTAKAFSKTLVRNWDKLCAYEDGEFKI